MTRTKQRLINYHTGKKAEMPIAGNVDYGEIVVRHNAESPELLIKVGDNSFGVFQASGAVQTAIDSAKSELTTSISNLEKSLSGHVANFEQFQTNVQTTYATKEELKSASGSIITAYTQAVADAKLEAIGAASGYTDTQVSAAEGRLNTAIADVASDLDSLSGVVESISTDIGDNYVTSADLKTTVETLEGQISSAKTEAIGEASGYTDTKFAAAKEYSDGKLSAATESLKQLISNVDENVTALSGNVHTTIENLDSKLTETINNKVAVAYRYQGSVDNYADLPKNLTSGETGYVYNVANANGHIPAGTNYAWNGTAWDALGGIVDLTPYAKASDVKNSVDGINQRIADVESSVSTLSGNTDSAIASLKQYTDDTFATKTALKTAQNDITQAIANAKLEAIETASGYTDTQVLAAKNALNQSIEKVDGRVTDLSGVTETVKTTADKAVQTASIVDGDTCKVSVNKEGTELKFDFSNLVIDCGDF